jgi:hypothetical protein
MKIVNLDSLNPEQRDGLGYVNAVNNAAAKQQFDADEAAKLAADETYAVQPFVPESDQDYADRVIRPAFDSYAAQKLTALRETVLPALDASKVVGLQKYLEASPEKQAQIKEILGV